LLAAALRIRYPAACFARLLLEFLPGAFLA
jgi:hypothetical protein